jgi:chromate transporter
MALPKQPKRENMTRAGRADFCTLVRLFYCWFKIGVASFGGGAVTQYLIQEYFIYRQGWLSTSDYTELWAMCQIAPGINILALTILIGNRLAGWAGVIASLFALVLPSAAITIGITALYTTFSGYTRVQASLRTVFAAIFGISIATNWRNAGPILVKNLKRGRGAFLVSLAIMLGGGVIYFIFKPPVPALYFLGGLAGALACWRLAGKKRED